MVCYYKVRQVFYYKVRQVFYYKVRQVLLQSATGMRSVTILLQSATIYKVRQYKLSFAGMSESISTSYRRESCKRIFFFIIFFVSST